VKARETSLATQSDLSDVLATTQDNVASAKAQVKRPSNIISSQF